MREEEELRRQARALYLAKADYLREIEPIVREMVKLKTLFSSPRLIVDVGDFTIHEEWISPEAATLYRNYEKLLESIYDRHVTSQHA